MANGRIFLVQDKIKMDSKSKHQPQKTNPTIKDKLKNANKNTIDTPIDTKSQNMAKSTTYHHKNYNYDTVLSKILESMIQTAINFYAAQTLFYKYW